LFHASKLFHVEQLCELTHQFARFADYFEEV
jgi:hypothetical protein